MGLSLAGICLFQGLTLLFLFFSIFQWSESTASASENVPSSHPTTTAAFLSLTQFCIFQQETEIHSIVKKRAFLRRSFKSANIQHVFLYTVVEFF